MRYSFYDTIIWDMKGRMVQYIHLKRQNLENSTQHSIHCRCMRLCDLIGHNYGTWICDQNVTSERISLEVNELSDTSIRTNEVDTIS
jgi:hypothetical protein